MLRKRQKNLFLADDFFNYTLVILAPNYHGRITHLAKAGPEVISFLSCSTQLSIKFKLLINPKIAHIY